MDTIKLLAIFAENKIGQLAHVTGLIAQANINIRWVTIASTESFGVIKLLADDTELACEQLKHQGVPVTIVDVLAIEVEDKPGGLHAVVRCLAANNINVENASGFVSGKRAVLFIEAKDLAQARRLLESNGIQILKGPAALQQKMW